jgi:DNA polymerase elongation subunit (family B)
MQLPKRNNYIEGDIYHGDDIIFMPNEIFDTDNSLRYGIFPSHKEYAVVMIGIFKNGEKGIVILTGAKPYVDFMIKNDEDEDIIYSNIISIVNQQNINRKIIYCQPFKYHTDEPSKFMRVYFDCKWARNQIIKSKVMSRFDIYSTEGNYHRVISREYDIIYSQWGKFSEFKKGYSIKCNRIFFVDVNNYKTCNESALNTFGVGKLLLATWDIETYNEDGIISTTRIVDKNGQEKDIVFMICMSFQWYYSNDPLVNVCITILPVEDTSDKVVIKCKNQREVVESFLKIINNMKPDFITGFNDGNYDWPVIMERIIHYGLLETAYNSISAVDNFMWNDADKKYIKCFNPLSEPKGNYFIGTTSYSNFEIKIASFSNMYKIKCLRGIGCINIDTLVAMLKKKPKVEKKSLNFFLGLNNLQSKVDMKYKRMNEIFKNLYWDSSIDLYKMTQKEIISARPDFEGYIGDVDKIAEYCLYDAHSCQLLLNKNNYIINCKEFAATSFITLHDCIYYADGIKVINITKKYASDMGFLFGKDKGKLPTFDSYSGAAVIPPKKGLYKDSAFDKLLRYLDKFSINLYDIVDKENLDSFANEFISFINDEICSEGITKLVKYLMMYSGMDEDKMVEKLRKICVDEYPVAALDFASLYPNIIITYNISPEMVIMDKPQNESDFYHITIDYDKKVTENKMIKTVNKSIDVWFKKHLGDESKMGVFPRTLNDLYKKRIKLKKIWILSKTYLEIAAKFKDIKQIITAIDNDFKRKEDSEIMHNFADELGIDLDKIKFKVMLLESKQLSVKLLMNTIYGVSGAKHSELANVIVAATITLKGQHLLWAVADKINKQGFDVKYGDTDSSYISAPKKCFVDINKKYIIGKISKEEFWIEKVLISMKNIRECSTCVNDYLKTMHEGMTYLKMDYEEVLFPVLFAGKKKYCGNSHIKNVNTKLFNKIDINEFKDFLFIKGLDIIKRGSTEFMKKLTYDVLQQMIIIDVNKSPMRIIKEKIDIIYDDLINNRYDYNIFKKKFKINLLTSKTLELIENHNKTYPDEKIDIDLIKTANDLPDFINKSEKMMFLSKLQDAKKKKNKSFSYQNNDFISFVIKENDNGYLSSTGTYNNFKVIDNMVLYKKARKNNVKINIDYYMKSLISQLSRCIVYKFTYDEYGNEISDKKAIDKAKRILINYYDKKFGRKSSEVLERKKQLMQKNRHIKSVVNRGIVNKDILESCKTNEVVTSLISGAEIMAKNYHDDNYDKTKMPKSIDANKIRSFYSGSYGKNKKIYHAVINSFIEKEKKHLSRLMNSKEISNKDIQQSRIKIASFYLMWLELNTKLNKIEQKKSDSIPLKIIENINSTTLLDF